MAVTQTSLLRLILADYPMISLDDLEKSWKAEEACRKARRHLIDFAPFIYSPYQQAAHLIELCGLITQVLQGDIDRAIMQVGAVLLPLCNERQARIAHDRIVVHGVPEVPQDRL